MVEEMMYVGGRCDRVCSFLPLLPQLSDHPLCNVNANVRIEGGRNEKCFGMKMHNNKGVVGLTDFRRMTGWRVYEVSVSLFSRLLLLFIDCVDVLVFLVSMDTNGCRKT